MKSLRGIISDKIRSIFPPGDIAYNPPRGTEPKSTGKKPHDGYPMTGRKKK